MAQNTRKRSRGNGEGSIYFNESKGKWIGQYTIGTNHLGKQQRKTFYGKTRKEVKDKLEAFISAVKDGSVQGKSNATIESLCTELVENKYKLNITGQSAYRRNTDTITQIKKHYIADVPIQKIGERDIKDFFHYLTSYSDSVISKNYSMLNNAFKRGVLLNIIRCNPLDDKQTFFKPKSSKATKKVSAFSIDSQRAFIEVLRSNSKTNYRVQMLLSLYTGMRMGEINALTLPCINLEDKKITVLRTLTRDENDKTVMGKKTKTYAGQREVVLNDVVTRILSEHLNDGYIENKEQLLFYDTVKTYVTTSQVNMQFKRICAKYNIDKGDGVNQHMLRHTFATRSIESGMSAKVLQKILGHADIQTTLNTYCDVYEQFEKDNTDRAYEYLKANSLII